MDARFEYLAGMITKVGAWTQYVQACSVGAKGMQKPPAITAKDGVIFNRLGMPKRGAQYFDEMSQEEIAKRMSGFHAARKGAQLAAKRKTKLRSNQ